MRMIPRLAVGLAVPLGMGAQTPDPPRPTFDFSSVVFGNFQMRTDSAAKFSTGGKPSSRFDIGRAYLTFRMPAGDRASIRVTTDIFQNTAAGYYAGWAVRLKYGILQYDVTKSLGGMEGLSAVARIGMLHTVVIEHVETFWPRWMGNAAVEQHGFFASADVGAASLFTFPARWGEAYVTVTNGSGYTAAETDRFKDIAARASITPFGDDDGIFRTFTITPWYYRGASASKFVLGGPGQLGAVSDGLRKDRRGLFVGLRDRRITAGIEYAQRLEQIESGSNTAASARVVSDTTTTLRSAFAVLRPLELIRTTRSPLSVIARLDRFTLSDAQARRNSYVVLGALWDLTSRVTLALDYQELSQSSPPATGATVLPTKTWFLHWVATF